MSFEPAGHIFTGIDCLYRRFKTAHKPVTGIDCLMFVFFHSSVPLHSFHSSLIDVFILNDFALNVNSFM